MAEYYFVSYARDDGEFVLRLSNGLREAGVSIWMDQLDLKPGDQWDAAVERALQHYSGLIVVLSPRSATSRNVMDEVSYALEENKTVLPVLMEQCDIPFRLRRFQRADFTSDFQTGLQMLNDAVGEPETVVVEDSGFPGSVEISTLQLDPLPSKTGNEPIEPAHIRQTWLVISAWFGLMGFVIGLTVGWIWDDLLQEGILLGAVGCIGWGMAGAIAGPNRVPLLSAVFGSAIGPLLFWLNGFDPPQMSNLFGSVVYGWPVGAILGSIIGRYFGMFRDHLVRVWRGIN